MAARVPACPVCGAAVGDVAELAAHLVEQAGASDIAHVMWLNRAITKHRTDVAQLTTLLEDWYAGRANAPVDKVRR